MKVLIIDNFDSFTYNLHHYVREFVEDCIVVRSNQISEVDIKNYDKIILIRSPLEVRIERVMNRDSLSRLEVMKRINNQLDENSIIDKCDYIINNQNIKNLKDKVLSIHLELKG